MIFLKMMLQDPKIVLIYLKQCFIMKTTNILLFFSPDSYAQSPKILSN